MGIKLLNFHKTLVVDWCCCNCGCSCATALDKSECIGTSGSKSHIKLCPTTYNLTATSTTMILYNYYETDINDKLIKNEKLNKRGITLKEYEEVLNAFNEISSYYKLWFFVKKFSELFSTSKKNIIIKKILN